MKKIVIFSFILFCTLFSQVYSACPINSLQSCSAEMNSGFGNTKLRDKILPDRIDKLKQPNNSFDDRTKQGQMHTPEYINREMIQRENTQPYNANCQFGNCINKNNTDSDSKQ